jgi:TetR/AcrR family acrAB operon transcriptional repressor
MARIGRCRSVAGPSPSDAALLTFADKGAGATTLADVAIRAGVTRGAVYHHFRDKNELYATVLTESWEALTEPVWAALAGAGPVPERLTRFRAAWLRRLRTDERFRALLTISVNDSMPMDEAVATAKARGLAEWRDRLIRLLTEPGERPKTGLATDVLAWLCGTAVLAATDLTLLPREPRRVRR